MFQGPNGGAAACIALAFTPVCFAPVVAAQLTSWLHTGTAKMARTDVRTIAEVQIPVYSTLKDTGMFQRLPLTANRRWTTSVNEENPSPQDAQGSPHRHRLLRQVHVERVVRTRAGRTAGWWSSRPAGGLHRGPRLPYAGGLTHTPSTCRTSCTWGFTTLAIPSSHFLAHCLAHCLADWFVQLHRCLRVGTHT